MIRFDKAVSEAKTEVEKFVVRLPGGMRQEIAEVARRSRRSMNSEIVARLERSLAESEVIETISENPPASAPQLRAVEVSRVQAGNEAEHRLLQAFRKLEQGRRDALLRLLD
ncbi:MAG: Arc family DNA-binding protein [Alcanivoracaceae bacterium]|nr:Arc family DNA-binding protein [Alcanivoracaceae bacterium]